MIFKYVVIIIKIFKKKSKNKIGTIIDLIDTMENKRREFLKNVCPSVALAFFGVTMLEACSSGGDDSEITWQWWRWQ